MIAYIAGRISGKKDYKKDFAAAAARLKEEGYTVLNPAALPKMEYHKYPDICMAMISAADMVYLLEGWEESAGAAWERAYALRMGKRIREE